MAYSIAAPVGILADHYQVLCEIGAGGMGVVFKAFDTKLERIVALKFLTQTSSNADERERLLREARAASNLDHENIATLYSVEENADGQLFLVMAYYEGESLAARMQREAVSVEEALHILRGIAAGLAHAHRHNVVHRDIKPSNVILTNEGVVKIIDFGLARFVGPEAATQSVNFGGTLRYMSPEQIAGKAADTRSDVWSLGVIAYELLARRSAFQSDNPASTVDSILHSEPDFTPLPAELRSTVSRMLCKEAVLRYPSATELLRDLEAIDAQSLTLDAPLVRPERQSDNRAARWRRACRDLLASRKVRVVVAFVLLALVTLAYFSSRKNSVVTTSREALSQSKTAAYESYLHGVEFAARYDKPGNLDAAIKSFQASTTADPVFALAWAALGNAYWTKYQLEEDAKWVDMAKDATRRAAQLNDRLPAVYVTLGRIHGGTGQHDLAIQEFQRAFELDRSNADALLGLADIYARVGRNDEAESNYKRAIAMRPGDWVGPNRLGRFYFDQSRYEEAAQQFRRVLELTPDHGLAHGSLGVTLIRLGKFAEAESELKRSITTAPNYAAYTNLGVLYYRHRRFAHAAAMMESALALNDKDYLLWEDLASSYEWLGRSDEAAQAQARERTLLEERIRISPQDAMMQADLGAVDAQQHLGEKALPHLEAALALAPNDANVLERLGEAQEFLGHRSKAIDYLHQAVNRGYPRSDLLLNPGLQALLSDPQARSVLQIPSPIN